MTWKQESKQVLQSMYGGYCNMCKILKQPPVIYALFTQEEYNKTKQLYDTTRNIRRK